MIGRHQAGPIFTSQTRTTWLPLGRSHVLDQDITVRSILLFVGDWNAQVAAWYSCNCCVLLQMLQRRTRCKLQNCEENSILQAERATPIVRATERLELDPNIDLVMRLSSL